MGAEGHTLQLEIDTGQQSTSYITSGSFPVVAAGQGNATNYAFGVLLTNAAQYNSVAGGTVTLSSVSSGSVAGTYAFDVSDGTTTASVSGQMNPTNCP